MATPRNEPNSIPNLINAAAHYAGYAVIIVDAPPSALAATAISVSNTLVLVARPSLEGILRTVEAYRTVVERLKGEHRIENNRVFMVLNRVGNRLSAEEWHRAATTTLGKAFPPIVAQIPDLPAVGHAQDNRRLPLVAVEEFSHALRPLADILLAQPGQDYPKLPALAAQRKVYQLGGLRVRL
jgi:cellulose biosynthesis protein BcsQ